MKKGISVAAYETQFGPIVYSASRPESLDAILKKVSDYGFDGVDLFINKKSEEELREIKSLLDKHGLEVGMLICIYLSEIGVNLSSSDEALRAKSIVSYLEEMDKAKILHPLSMPLGFIRGKRAPDESMQENMDRLAFSIRILLKRAKENGIKLCIEPINRYEANTLPTVEETVKFIDDYDLKGIYILADLFHMNIEDTDIPAALELAGDKIGHMHVPDSNRKAPGMGHMDYTSVIKALKKIGYDGYLSMESDPFGDRDGCAGKGADYLTKLIKGE